MEESTHLQDVFHKLWPESRSVVELPLHLLLASATSATSSTAGSASAFYSLSARLALRELCRRIERLAEDGQSLQRRQEARSVVQRVVRKLAGARKDTKAERVSRSSSRSENRSTPSSDPAGSIENDTSDSYERGILDLAAVLLNSLCHVLGNGTSEGSNEKGDSEVERELVHVIVNDDCIVSKLKACSRVQLWTLTSTSLEQDIQSLFLQWVTIRESQRQPTQLSAAADVFKAHFHSLVSTLQLYPCYFQCFRRALHSIVVESKASTSVLVLAGYLCSSVREGPPSSATGGSHHSTDIDVAKIGYVFPLWQYIDSLKACKCATDFKSAVVSRRKVIQDFETVDQCTLEVEGHDIVWFCTLEHLDLVITALELLLSPKLDLPMSRRHICNFANFCFKNVDDDESEGSFVLAARLWRLKCVKAHLLALLK